MEKIPRRSFVAILGASSLSGCAAIMGESRNKIADIPVRSCSSSPTWPLFQKSSLRDGSSELDIQREPDISETTLEDLPVGQTGMLLLYGDYVLSFWRHNNTIYRHHKSSGETNSLSLKSQIRNYPGLNCSIICVHTKSNVYWIDIREWEVIKEINSGGSYTDVLIDKDCIYLPYKSGVQAYLRNSGEASWHYKTDGLPTGLSSSETELYIIEGGRENKISSIRKRSGEKRWVQNRISETYSNPIIGDSIYLKTNRGGIISLEKGTGNINWSVDYSRTSGQYATPAVRENQLYMPDTGKGEILAIDGITGDIIWRTSIPPREGKKAAMTSFTSPISTTDKIVIGCGEKGLACLSNNSGEILWRKPSYNIISPIMTDEECLYAMSPKGLIKASPEEK